VDCKNIDYLHTSSNFSSNCQYGVWTLIFYSINNFSTNDHLSHYHLGSQSSITQKTLFLEGEKILSRAEAYLAWYFTGKSEVSDSDQFSIIFMLSLSSFPYMTWMRKSGVFKLNQLKLGEKH